MIPLDLSKVPMGQRKQAKQEVGNFVVNEILRFVEQGNSPVKNLGKFKQLTEKYAQENKGGNRTPNLELFGDMLDSLTSRNRKDGVEVGIFARSEVPKADGHNNFSGDSKLPQRRFIPEENQTFKRRITSGIKDIVQSFEGTGEAPPPGFNLSTAALGVEGEATIEIAVDDILGQSLFDSLFES